MNNDKPTLGWTIDTDNDPMSIIVYDVKSHEPLMRLFIGEAIELAGRLPVMSHIREIERSKWIRSWHGNASYKIKNLEFFWNPDHSGEQTIDVIHASSKKCIKSYPFDSSKNTIDEIVTNFLRFIGES